MCAVTPETAEETSLAELTDMAALQHFFQRPRAVIEVSGRQKLIMSRTVRYLDTKATAA
jgi:hypothetical protein